MNNIRLCLTSSKTVAFPKYILSKCDYFGSIRKFSVGSQRNMKLVQFVYRNQPDVIRAGYFDGNNVVDINKIDRCLPSTILDILRNGHLETVKCMPSQRPASIPLCDIDLAAPVHGMDKVLCIGLNYHDHCTEQHLLPPSVPMIFSKFSSSVIGSKDVLILKTDVTCKVDWEVELVVVIGQTASNVCAANAYEYVAGYTIAQDISARDWQKERNAGQFLLGKSMDGFCPLGPCIVTTDELPDPQALNISCSINGVPKQWSNTCQLVHKIPDVIARLSSVMTLYPGDILLTGTPGGVGMYRSPPEFLKPGDVILSEIQCIGQLVTRVG